MQIILVLCSVSFLFDISFFPTELASTWTTVFLDRETLLVSGEHGKMSTSFEKGGQDIENYSWNRFTQGEGARTINLRSRAGTLSKTCLKFTARIGRYTLDTRTTRGTITMTIRIELYFWIGNLQ